MLKQTDFYPLGRLDYKLLLKTNSNAFEGPNPSSLKETFVETCENKLQYKMGSEEDNVTVNILTINCTLARAVWLFLIDSSLHNNNYYHHLSSIINKIHTTGGS